MRFENLSSCLWSLLLEQRKTITINYHSFKVSNQRPLPTSLVRSEMTNDAVWGRWRTPSAGVIRVWNDIAVDVMDRSPRRLFRHHQSSSLGVSLSTGSGMSTSGTVISLPASEHSPGDRGRNAGRPSLVPAPFGMLPAVERGSSAVPASHDATPGWLGEAASPDVYAVD